MIVIVDYQMGNLGSIANALKKLGFSAMISSDANRISKADKLILPGVGAFDNGMKNIINLGLVDILNQKVQIEKTPVLGICLGMQLLTQKSEEGSLPGLGYIKGETVRFKFDEDWGLHIPHMGWNTIEIKKNSYLFSKMYDEPRFYFVHSYYVVCDNYEEVIAKTRYGLEFISAIQKDNIVGTQFHPEKSQKFGLKILKNFAEG